MTEIKQLRKDIATLETAERLAGGMPGRSHVAGAISSIVYDKRAELAKLEAEAADRWAKTKIAVNHCVENGLNGSVSHDIALYARHLEQRIAELEAEMKETKNEAEQQEAWAATFDSLRIRAENEQRRLQAELAKRPKVYCVRTHDGIATTGSRSKVPRVFLAESIEDEYGDGAQRIEPYTGEQS